MTDLRVARPIRPTGPGTEHGMGDILTPEMIAEHFAMTRDSLAELTRRIAAPKRHDDYVGIASGNTDSSGNLTLAVMQARQGFSFNLRRALIEAATFDASAYTPAVPYTNAAFWTALFVSDDPTSVAQGQMLDFPAPLALPASAEYGDEEGPLIRAGEWLVLYVKTGPASKRITCRYQGLYEAIEL